MIDWPTGHVVVRYKNEHGEERVEDEHMDLPPDLADGVIITLLKGVRREALPPSVSLVAAMPKPRLVEVTMAIGGTEPFSVAGSAPKATHYFLKIEIGGIAALVAPLVGKQPPDSHVWILDGEASAFVRSQAATFNGRSSVADGPRESHLAQLTTSLVAVTSAGAAIDDARS